ncbi:hypothetical protein B0H13DRAFT_1158315 [Mycena leptocephala]|nr:hypothetical protein B0H13DRAFT_1158315 [Mycena leptocephala]
MLLTPRRLEPSHWGETRTPFTEDRVKWNQEWEEEIAWLLSPGVPKPIELLRHFHVHIATEESETEMQHMLAMHRAKYGLLCQCLARLAQAVAVSFATHDFRRRWLAASPAVREEHILKGLVRACSEIESFRRYCDELTLPYLQRGGGHGFLDLLKHFTLDDYTQVPTKPIYLKSPHWYPADPTAEPKEAYELADAAFNVERSSLIGHTLHATLCSFLGVNHEKTNRAKRDVAKSRLFREVAQKMLTRTYGPAAAKETHKKTLQKSKARIQIAVCESCEKTETPGEERFMRCKACMDNVSRKVYYCSRQCQREDWKVRHKRICGKAMTVKESEETANVPLKPSAPLSADSPQIIGPPINGFKRSPALIYQVNLLNENAAAETDYLLITRTQRVFRLKIDDKYEKRRVPHIPPLGLTTGDREAVATIGQFLVKKPGGAVAMFGDSTSRCAWAVR